MTLIARGEGDLILAKIERAHLVVRKLEAAKLMVEAELGSVRARDTRAPDR